MRPLHTFTVAPALPPRLARLHDLAYNLWWTWDYEASSLFHRIDPILWEASGHNPVLMLGQLQQDRLEQAARDEGFLAHLDRVWERFQEYVRAERTWYDQRHGDRGRPCIAYFSFEYGLAECLPMYSGGLGVLAGDHLKSASDLGIPLVGVGVLYQEGFFRQYLNADGWQGELYPDNDFYNLPVQLERRPDGSPVTVQVEYPGRVVTAQVWRVQVGRVPLYLLDTNLPSNQPADRDITDRLYAGDSDLRIRQEILMGIGGIRALQAVGLRPVVCHMNEGHSAFLALERVRVLMEELGLSFAEAREVAAAGHVFTTHTPVPAGIDLFSPQLIDAYFEPWYRTLGISRQEFMALGRQNPRDENEPFSMAVLALRLSAAANGVSKLHQQVSRRLWRGVWPNVPVNEIPISAVTNGVHAPSWIAGQDIASLFDRYLGPRWRDDPSNGEVWEGVRYIPDEELWRSHERRREHLVSFARQRLVRQLEQRGAPQVEVSRAAESLDPTALTIGFARRFATYKRATLLLRDPERLARILTDRDRPVQLIVAGKAHPHDNAGKEFIRQIVHFSRREDVARHVVFIEDYDLQVARYLMQGVDLWLTTPRRPLEASGTSGMKVALNGGLNMSVLDGWWDEAFSPEVGWAIGRGEEYADLDLQDEVESRAVYDLLEKEVVPMFYERGADRLPRRWIKMMKSSIATIAPFFNTHRMVRQYAELFYLPAVERYERLVADGARGAKELAAWKARLAQHWSHVRVEDVRAEAAAPLRVGSAVQVKARVHLGALAPGDVSVELFYGGVDAGGEIRDGASVPMVCVEGDGAGRYQYVGVIACRNSGLHGFTVRVLPQHEALPNPFEPGLVYWAEAPASAS
ncbi:MAG TPA: alpha-glucan family phosphorylase [Chloroflexota bacterium]